MNKNSSYIQHTFDISIIGDHSKPVREDFKNMFAQYFSKTFFGLTCSHALTAAADSINRLECMQQTRKHTNN